MFQLCKTQLAFSEKKSQDFPVICKEMGISVVALDVP